MISFLFSSKHGKEVGSSKIRHLVIIDAKRTKNTGNPEQEPSVYSVLGEQGQIIVQKTLNGVTM